jgi:NADH-quinone oxidoreductase subunit A
METNFLQNIPIDYLTIIVQLIVVLGFVVTTLFVTHMAGPKIKTDEKLQAFECGLDSIGDARLPFSIKYFLAAILFVLFDAELIFFYPWAVNFKELGGVGFFKMIAFVAPFMLGFYYIIKKGALKWE